MCPDAPRPSRPPTTAVGSAPFARVDPCAASFSVYAATKVTLRSLTRSRAAERVTRGIRVNVVAPGPVETPGLTGLADGPRATEQLSAGRRRRPTWSGRSADLSGRRTRTAPHVVRAERRALRPGAGRSSGSPRMAEPPAVGDRGGIGRPTRPYLPSPAEGAPPCPNATPSSAACTTWAWRPGSADR
ncbi:SDR family oxidoreductase [Streptomyces galbus]|uniref:SDR family oxidoreductase n=1 Tax=Streptomyces galbus TaxID=33898 RepID=UPI0035E3CCBA